MKQACLVVGTSLKLIREVLLALKADGRSNNFVIGGPDTSELRRTRLCRGCEVINIDRPDLPNDDQHFIRLVTQHAHRQPGLVLIAADVEGAKLIGRTRHALPVPIAPVAPASVLAVLDDKWRFHQLCTAHGLRVPETVRIDDKATVGFRELVAAVGLPMVIKPANQAGSTGVLLIRSERDFDRLVRNNPGYTFEQLLAQQYIAGVDLCFNLLAVDGQLHAQSLQRRDGHIVSFFSLPALEDMGRRLAGATGYSGPMCIDARLETGTGKVWLIESNPRFWASLNASTWCGLNFVSLAASLAAGGSASSTSRLSQGRFNERHPLLRPAAWLRTLTEGGARGRLLRASVTDLPMLSRILRHQAKRLLPQRRPAALARQSAWRGSPTGRMPAGSRPSRSRDASPPSLLHSAPQPPQPSSPRHTEPPSRQQRP